MSKWPSVMNEIWAKSPIGQDEHGESLVAHTWEVLSRLRDLAKIRPGLPEICGLPNLWHILFWAAFLHDWGKAASGFQAMLRGEGRWLHRHEVLSLIFIDWIADILSEEECLAVSAAIVSHHKDAEELDQIYSGGFDIDDDPIKDLLDDLEEKDLKVLHFWLEQFGAEWITKFGFDQLGVYAPKKIIPRAEAIQIIRENGISRLRKRFRDYCRLIQKLRDGDCPSWVLPGLVLRGCLIESDYIGSAHAGKLPFLDISKEIVLTSAEKKEDELYEHQRNALGTEDSAILIAPTGSGKTEAAMLWATKQVLDKSIPRLFYALPYQASMNAMYDRLNAISPGKVGLLHSRSLLAMYRRLMEQEYAPELAVQKARWLRNLSKLRYQPIQIFSPYQMLKAAYQLKGYEAMLVDFAGSAFIFDEIHAYEPERFALILEFLRFLREKLKASFFVMSATLPSVIQKHLKDALGSPALIQSSKEVFQRFTRHKVNLLKGELLSDEGLAKIKDFYKKGKSVLVTCNTVSLAQEVYNRLSSDVPEESLILVHSRFNGLDRLGKEQKIIELTGLKSKKRRPVIVVSTQVVEVSLNIDLDVLFSDPAPLEALLQRFGRVNRGGRAGIAPVYVFTEPNNGQGVYSTDLVKEAIKVLYNYADGNLLNEGAVQGWLDEIYTGDVLEDWERRYQITAKEFREAFIKNLQPFASDKSFARAFERLFDGVEVLPACFEKEYKEVYAQNPIEASQFMVPISWKQWKRLNDSKKICSIIGSWPLVVDVPYTSEYGLDFTNSFKK